MSDERGVIEVNCAVPGHWVDEVLGGVHDGGLPEDPRTPCVSAAEMDEMVSDGDSGYVPIAALHHWARGAAKARAENERLREALRIEERFQRVSGNGRQADALAAILDGTTDWPTTPAWSQSETAPTPRPPDVDQLRSALRDIAAIADRAKAWNIKARQDVLDICAASFSETGGEE